MAVIQAKLGPKAEQDLNELCGCIAAKNPDAATRVRQTILHTFDFLAHHRDVGMRIRKAVLSGFGKVAGSM